MSAFNTFNDPQFNVPLKEESVASIFPLTFTFVKLPPVALIFTKSLFPAWSIAQPAEP